MPSPAKPPRAWQRMLSGRRLDLLDPSPLDVELEDIAHGLARVARWNGQTRGEHVFSVAQHSLLVEAVAVDLQPGLSPADQLAVLLHDAPEYVIGDIISPFKAVVGTSYKDVEARLLGAIRLRFGLKAVPAAPLQRFVKRCDRLAAYLEATRLAGFSHEEGITYFGRPEPLGEAVEAFLAPWPTEVASARYRAAVEATARG